MAHDFKQALPIPSFDGGTRGRRSLGVLSTQDSFPDCPGQKIDRCSIGSAISTTK